MDRFSLSSLLLVCHTTVASSCGFILLRLVSFEKYFHRMYLGSRSIYNLREDRVGVDTESKRDPGSGHKPPICIRPNCQGQSSIIGSVAQPPRNRLAQPRQQPCHEPCTCLLGQDLPALLQSTHDRLSAKRRVK